MRMFILSDRSGRLRIKSAEFTIALNLPDEGNSLINHEDHEEHKEKFLNKS